MKDNHHPPAHPHTRPLAHFFFSDPRLFLVPIEHLSPEGMSPLFAEWVAEHRGWTPAHVALFNDAFSLYWNRTARLAEQTSSWPRPRLRHVAVVREAATVLPYAQLLNTSAWTLYDTDFDPERSHAELAGYLFAHGDRMAITGEVTMAALQNAAYWLDRSDDEVAAFGEAAKRSERPDADAFRLLAEALPWLRKIRHETLRPPADRSGHRAIPNTGLLVPQALEAAPQELVDSWRDCARQTVERFHRAHRGSDPAAILSVLEWLAESAPSLLVTARHGRILWDPETPSRLGPLRNELRRAAGIALHDMHADLRVLNDRTRRFLESVADTSRLAEPNQQVEQTGYTFLHRDRRLLAYNLDEAGIDRLRSPALPYARFMLGARALHEWAHLAVDAGFVPRQVSEEDAAAQVGELADQLDEVVRNAPEAIQRRTSKDLAELTGAPPRLSPGEALAGVLLARISDYRANLLAARFWSVEERETYVRQNIRTLRGSYGPEQTWRMLVRYLYEYQYLRFSAVENRPRYFLRSTWFDDDFFASRILDERRLEELARSVAKICDGYAVDAAQFRF